ncbi:MAG: hypothetical protein JNK76_24670 [Planctomycetales bacterium]|nr:hypothetical protein [Planctomycetales bacterium]MBN8626604.1 hypothetical protein [Planctomycetota bacterium]
MESSLTAFASDTRFEVVQRRLPDLILSFQRSAAIAASRLLDTLGVLHHLAGNVVELPGRSLLVEDGVFAA